MAKKARSLRTPADEAEIARLLSEAAARYQDADNYDPDSSKAKRLLQSAETFFREALKLESSTMPIPQGATMQ